MLCKKVDEKNISKKHIPVLLKELTDSINLQKKEQNIVVDCTL